MQSQGVHAGRAAGKGVGGAQQQQGLPREDWELLHRSRTREAFYEKACIYLNAEGGDHWCVPTFDQEGNV